MNEESPLQEDIQFKVLRRLHERPDSSQRLLSRELGVSLGSINYCFQALVEKGLVKMQSFGQSKHKLGYVYLLTPSGIAEKSRLTAKFLKQKMEEYDALYAEIGILKSELNRQDVIGDR